MADLVWTGFANGAILPRVDDYIVTLVQTDTARTNSVWAASVAEAARRVNEIKGDPIGACYSVRDPHGPDSPSTVQVLPGRIRVMQDCRIE